MGIRVANSFRTAEPSPASVILRHMARRQFLIDEFKALRKSYRAPKYPIFLCHGLFGFDTLRFPGGKLDYWYNIPETLEKYGAKVEVGRVPPVASIHDRAQILYDSISGKEELRKVNLIAHSMGGLDARYLIAKLAAKRIQVLSLTTISTPHHGTPAADVFFDVTSKLPTTFGALAQLSTTSMAEFNKNVLDDPTVKYFSYGARFFPNWVSWLRVPWGIIYRKEGDNDGLVSCKSAEWGEYQGTLENCDHWDVINLTHLKPRALRNAQFHAPVMYLHVMDQLSAHGF